MSVFVRSFCTEALSKWDAEHPDNAIRSLFTQWAMPGCAATRNASLRLGVRQQYVNFYVQGQSVAKLSCGCAGPRVSVHKAYVEGRIKGSAGHDDMSPRQDDYHDYDADELASPGTTSSIPSWVSTAETYASAEKRFVDRLIEANAGVIDLEMGLPASDTAQGETKTAPRIDLVIAQAPSAEPVSIAFWEAKCSINPDLRARAEYAETADGKYVAGPKVIHQLRKYQQWMLQDDRLAEMQCAYKATAEIMRHFYGAFGSKCAPKPECVSVWEMLAASSKPQVILPPGVVIGNYCPTGHKPLESVEALLFGHRAENFGFHRDKLTRHGVTTHQVGVDFAGHGLPLLAVGKVSA